MPCYTPLRGYRAAVPNDNGKRPIVFSPRGGFVDMPVDIPCGQCIGCRLERSRQWAMRCVHESELYDRNCFITLTYNDACLPDNYSLVKRDFQLFMKRLRRKYWNGKKSEAIRFYACGEYGEKTQRPHYHACLFNHDFDDKCLFTVRDDVRLYVSEELQALWPYGFSTIGDVTFESAAYVARYILKKMTGEGAARHYETVDETTGEVFERVPEFTLMSRRPGIGRGWLDRFSSDVYPSDEVVIRNRRMKPPKYYDRIFEAADMAGYRDIRGARVRRAKEHAEDNTPERRRVRERVALANVKRLPRSVE